MLVASAPAVPGSARQGAGDRAGQLELVGRGTYGQQVRRRPPLRSDEPAPDGAAAISVLLPAARAAWAAYGGDSKAPGSAVGTSGGGDNRAAQPDRPMSAPARTVWAWITALPNA